MTHDTCTCRNDVNVPITGITVPFCGFGVTIDADKLPKCECGLTRDDVLAMIEAAATAVKEEIQIVIEGSRYRLCDFYFFRNPALLPGFAPAQGALLENAATLYPEAWAYLQSAEGQALCKTEAEWQAMTQAIWHTNANGTKAGWDGVGGAPFYAPDVNTGALRLPDLRGMYAEAAGFDSLAVGGVHGDMVRNMATSAWIRSAVHHVPGGGITPPFIGATIVEDQAWQTVSVPGHSIVNFGFNAALSVPTGNKNAPRAWGAFPCVYLGRPAA